MAAVTENDVLEEIRDQLEAIKVPGAKDAKPENTWSELDVDSLDLVELVKALEDRFDITISDDDLKPIESVGDAIALTMRLIEAKRVRLHERLGVPPHRDRDHRPWCRLVDRRGGGRVRRRIARASLRHRRRHGAVQRVRP